MSSSKNLSQFFAAAGSHQQTSKNDSPLSRTPSSYNVHSKAVDAEDDDHFETTSFQLKRTRSVGLLDEFIAPTKKLIEEDQENSVRDTSKHSIDQLNDEDDGNQFIENVDDEPKVDTKAKQVIYAYDDENYDTYDNDDNYDTHANDENSPSPPDSPDVYQPHDDNDISYEPSRHVDYLSYNWKEADISKSWRYIVMKRKDVANSARLENASWRTWAQAKYHLKTVSPESVNWLKESDVTWLYGPLYKEPDHNSPSVEKKYGSDTESSSVANYAKKKKKIQSKKSEVKGPKPILKKRTVSEMLTQPSNIRLPHHHHHHAQQHPHVPSPPTIDDDFDLISQKVNAQYSNKKVHEPSPSFSELNPTGSTSSILNNDSASESVKRHIHFNDRVEQCIALNYPDTDEEDLEDGADEYSSGDDQDSEDSDDEGGFFLQVRSPSSVALHTDFPSIVSDNEYSLDPKSDVLKGDKTANQFSRLKIIESLPATTLKYGSDDEEEDNYAVSHNVNTSRGYNYRYDYNSVFKGNENDNFLLDQDNYDYADTPQHLEGVNLVDVPENIVLGSNVEIVDTPNFEDSNSTIKKDSNNSALSNSIPITKPTISKRGFSLESDSEDESSSE